MKSNCFNGKNLDDQYKQSMIFETQYEDTLDLWKKYIGIPLDKTFKEQYNFSTNKQKKTLIDKLIDLWYEIFTYPDPTIDWSTSADRKRL